MEESVESVEPVDNGNSNVKLSAIQKARIERNRQAALLKRQKQQETLSTEQLSDSPTKKKRLPTGKDSGGGFLIEKRIQEEPKTDEGTTHTESTECLECHGEFIESYLRKHFDYSVCDKCRDNELHDLIPRTEAKKEYLVNDVGLDKRDPPLKCILKKNPHERARSEMRLYLRLQIEQRAIEVWGSEEELEAERDKRTDKQEERKHKSYFKKLKELRLSTRSSLYTRDFSAHTHEFDEPVLIDEDNDLYEKTCKTCGHKVEFEEM